MNLSKLNLGILAPIKLKTFFVAFLRKLPWLFVLMVAPFGHATLCEFAPTSQMDLDTGVEPRLLIDGTCIDPVYNTDTFVITQTEQLEFQVPDGPLIPYTQVTGHFPATNTLATLPDGVRQSPTTFQQNYVFRFPAKAFWQYRSFEQQHPSGGGVVDDQLAFTSGAFSVNWMSASAPNAVASHRHQAGATQVAKAYARTLYDTDAKIYSYFWGCSGGGTVAMAAAENTRGVWDGVQAQCIGTRVDAQYHSFYWQAHYTMAIPKAKRMAIATAAAPGGSGDIYAGLNDEESAVLDEFLAAGYPLAIIGRHFDRLTPLIDPIDVRLGDPSYEDDFWSLPGYAGSNPPAYLQAALIDGYVTVTDITRDAAGVPTTITFDLDELPEAGTTGDNYLEYYVYDEAGARLIDPNRSFGPPPENKRRFSLIGDLDRASGVLSLTGTIESFMAPPTPIVNSPVLLSGLKIGGKVRVNNRFILSMYYYPRYSVVEGVRSHDQYRHDDGTPIYPQRPDLSALLHSSYRTMGGRVESGEIQTKTMVITGMADQLSWPIFNVGYAERVQAVLGPEASAQQFRFYLHDNGSHSTGGGEPGIFRQSIQDFIAWVENDIPPPPSTVYSVERGQVIPAAAASARRGLQPVIDLRVNGQSRAEVTLGEPVSLTAHVEMPPEAGLLVDYSWSLTEAGNAALSVQTPEATGRVEQYDAILGDAQEQSRTLETPQTELQLARSVTLPSAGRYILRLTVHGQRDGLSAPTDRTLLQNFQDVQIVVD